ncbi:hypothetical protein ACXM0N_06640 [Peribacillus simplex]
MAIETRPPFGIFAFWGFVLYAMKGSSLTSATTFKLGIDVQALTFFSG